MAINFPANPSVDDTHAVGDVIWRWDGTAWRSNSTFNGLMPVGNTALRGTDPTPGTIRYNSEIVAFEGYRDDGWSLLDAEAIPETPTGLSPNTAVVANETFTLTASAYSHILDTAHQSSDWQISADIEFGNTEVENLNDTTNLTSYEITDGINLAGGIGASETYYWRVRYRDADNVVSEWSTPVQFDNEIPEPSFGDSFRGGFYVGAITAAGQCYRLIVAPNSTGCARCVFGSSADWNQRAGSDSCIDGFDNTYTYLNGSIWPAGNFCATRTINGFSDWYLPAVEEAAATGQNHIDAELPNGEDFSFDRYVTSTEIPANEYSGYGGYFTKFNWHVSLRNGSCVSYDSGYAAPTRAFRREPI